MECRFFFSDVVVVDNDQIGVIVKSWDGDNGVHHEVYVRSYNEIRDYPEKAIRHFIYSKLLSEEEKEFYEDITND